MKIKFLNIFSWVVLLPFASACETSEIQTVVEEIVTVIEETEYVDRYQDGTGSTPQWTTCPVRIGILGDSISTFDRWIPYEYVAYYPYDTLDDVSYTWWHRLIYTLMPDAVLDKNLSYSATRVAKTETESTYDQNDFVTRCTGFDNPDIVIIHGGTNDRSTAPLGDYDYDLSVDELDRYSFRPAYICMIKKIMEAWPGVRIVCIIGDCLYLDEYVSFAESIETIAEYYDLPVVRFQDSLESFDGVHPDENGHRYMARKIYETIEEEDLLYYNREENL